MSAKASPAQGARNDAASKRVVAHNIHYAISLDHQDMANSSEAFCGKLRCNAKSTEYAIYDDSDDPYGLKTGKPRRELGIISYKKKLLGPTELIMVMPRVRKDGACAQFLPSQPEESMIQLFKAGRVDHMFILRGTANVAPGGVVELALPLLHDRQVVQRGRNVPVVRVLAVAGEESE